MAARLAQCVSVGCLNLGIQLVEGDHGKQRARMANECGSLSQPIVSEDGEEVDGHMETVLQHWNVLHPSG